MTETEFLHHTAQLFAHIEDKIDEGGWDLDCQTSGNVLSIANDDGEEIIINRHTATQELWLAAKSGGHHFTYQNQQWKNTRDGRDFFDVLNQTLSELAQDNINLPVFQAA